MRNDVAKWNKNRRRNGQVARGSSHPRNQRPWRRKLPRNAPVFPSVLKQSPRDSTTVNVRRRKTTAERVVSSHRDGKSNKTSYRKTCRPPLSRLQSSECSHWHHPSWTSPRGLPVGIQRLQTLRALARLLSCFWRLLRPGLSVRKEHSWACEHREKRCGS